MTSIMDAPEVLEPMRAERAFSRELPPSSRPKRGTQSVVVQEAYKEHMPKSERFDQRAVKHIAFTPLTEDMILDPASHDFVFLHEGAKPYHRRQLAGQASQIHHGSIMETIDGLLQHLLGVRNGRPTVGNLIKFMLWSFKETGYST